MSDNKKKKEPRRKPKYSTMYCIKWLLTRMWKWDKAIIITTFAIIPFSVVGYALGLYTPSIILDKLQTSDTFTTVLLTIISLLLAQMVFNLVESCIHSVRGYTYHRNAMRFYYELIKKQCTDDPYLIIEPEYLEKSERAYNVLGNGANGGPGHFVLNFSDIAVNVICFLLFGSVISTLDPWIVAFLAAGSCISSVLHRWQIRRNYSNVDERAKNGKKINYLTWRLGADMRAGKDIRVYDMSPFLEEKGRVLLDEHVKLLKHNQFSATVFTTANNVIIALRDGIAYFFLIKGVFEGSITPAAFVLYFSAISQMSGFIGSITGYFSNLYETKLKTSDCIEFLDEEHGKMNHGKGAPLPQNGAVTVEFRNVSYKYPKGEKKILDNVSFKIEAGEKISLVGLNGAGKTTLAKLMCGLLLPDEGEVLINGHTTLEYNRDELFSLFTLTSQHACLLPTSVAENIALCDRKEIDDGRLWQALEKADIADKIRSLKHGADTGMVKTYDAEAVDFSGGEKQKIMLARAIYHSACVMILDEPTAALDPIAENEMYKKYNDISGNTTSVFISHRLASARFCDRIYLLDGARFAECGSHDELMALGGKYKELFDIQSKYYKEGAVNEEQ